MANRIFVRSSTARIPESDEEIPSIVRDRTAVHRLANGAAAFVPEFYEPNYAYPLLVWFSRCDAMHAEFHRRMAGISTRNMLGLHLPVFPLADVRQLLEAVRDGVRDLRRTWHVHTERIVLAGAGSRGTAALQAFLARPEWFAGAVVIRGRMTRPPGLPLRDVSLRGRRVLFVGGDEQGESQPVRLLNAAGLEVTVKRGDAPSPLAEVNAWMMAGVCVAA